MEELIGSAAGGGLLGLFGSAVNRVFAVWETREARENMRVSNAHELLLLEEQRQSNLEETEQELNRMDAQLVGDLNRLTTSGSYEGLAASLEHDSSLRSQDTYPWVNAVRSLVRPVLTGSLIAWMGVAAFALSQGQQPVIEALTFAGTTAIVWWFGDRSPRTVLR